MEVNDYSDNRSQRQKDVLELQNLAQQEYVEHNFGVEIDLSDGNKSVEQLTNMPPKDVNDINFAVESL